MNTGEAFVGVVGTEDHVEFTAIGDNVNITARLASAAGAGEVLVARAAAEAAALADIARPEQRTLDLRGRSEATDVFVLRLVERPRPRNVGPHVVHAAPRTTRSGRVTACSRARRSGTNDGDGGGAPREQDWTYRAARKRMLRAGSTAAPAATARLDDAGNRIVGAAAAGPATRSAGPSTSTASCVGRSWVGGQAQIDRSARWQDAARNGLTLGSSVVSRWWSLGRGSCADQVAERGAGRFELVDPEGDRHLLAIHASRSDELDVHAGIAEPLGRIGDRSRLVVERGFHNRYLAESNARLVQGAPYAGLIGRVEGGATAITDSEGDHVRQVDPAVGDRARVARELAGLVGCFNDEPLHRHLLWRHRASSCPGCGGATWVLSGRVGDGAFACPRSRPSSVNHCLAGVDPVIHRPRLANETLRRPQTCYGGSARSLSEQSTARESPTMRAPAIQRPTVGILIAALVLTLGLQHATAPAVDARTDDTAEVTIFIHGYSGGDCEGDWGFLIDHMRAKGWTGSSTCRSSCRATRTATRDRHGDGVHELHRQPHVWFGHSGTTHSNNTSIRHLAWHLANYIATNFTAKGMVSTWSLTPWAV